MLLWTLPLSSHQTRHIVETSRMSILLISVHTRLSIFCLSNTLRRATDPVFEVVWYFSRFVFFLSLFFIYFWCEALDSFREAWWLNLQHFMKRDLTSHQVQKQWTKVSVSITRHLLLTNSQKSPIKNHRYIHKCLISSCFYRLLYISQIGAINTISIRVCEHLRTRCLL